LFTGKKLFIVPYDDERFAGFGGEITKAVYLSDEANYAQIEFRPDRDPVNSWAVPFVTGHKYKIHWEDGLDFDEMDLIKSTVWEKTDKDIQLVHNFTQATKKIGVSVLKDGSYQEIDGSQNELGMPMTGQLEFTVNGLDNSAIKLKGYKSSNYLE
jgi:hypothetical protein